MTSSEKITKTNSKAFFLMKAFAIISVAAAHCTYSLDAVRRALSLIGIMGVPIFMVLSGMFSDCRTDWIHFVKKKFHRIVVPWIILGSMTYLLSVYLGTGKTWILSEYINWMIGHGTWLYFVPALLICSVICRLKSSKSFYYAAVCIGIVSNLLYIIKIIPLDGKMTAYQNPLNWLVFSQSVAF